MHIINYIKRRGELALFIICIGSCDLKPNVKEKSILFKEVGFTSQFENFSIVNDTLEITLDEIPLCFADSKIYADVSFMIDGINELYFHAFEKDCKFELENKVKIPLSSFEALTEINPLGSVDYSDSIVKIVTSGLEGRISVISSSPFYLLDVHLSSGNPAFRVVNKNYEPTYFCRFRWVNDTIVINQVDRLYQLDDNIDNIYRKANEK